MAKFISFSGHEISEECKELSLCMHPRKQLFKKMFTDQLIISYFLYIFFLYPHQIQTRVPGKTVWYVCSQCDYFTQCLIDNNH